MFIDQISKVPLRGSEGRNETRLVLVTLSPPLRTAPEVSRIYELMKNGK